MTDKKRYAKISGLTVRECHQYKGTWKPKLGEKLACEESENNPAGSSVIEVLRTDSGHSVGQAPRELWSHFTQFLTEGGHITAEVKETKFTSVSSEKEIFCDYILQGPSKATIGEILNDLHQVLQGPGLKCYNPSIETREDTYCCYFHHAVSKAPDLEAKCKAMSKYPKRRRTCAAQSVDCPSSDPRCSYHKETGLERKHAADTSSARKHVTETTSERKHMTETTSERKHVTETTSERKHVTETTSERKHVTETTSERKYVTKTTPERKQAEKISERKHVTETSERKHISQTSERKYVAETTSERKQAETISERKHVTETSERKHVSETSERKHVPETTSERKHVAETTSERKHVAETSSSVVADHVPQPLSQKKSELADISDPKVDATGKENGDLLPEELENDPWTREIYESAIEQGQEIDYTMRLMVIGCYGQGKSSLTKRLMGQSIANVESTNGIEVNICEISNEGFKWEQKINEDAATESIKRLVSVARSNSSASLESLNTDDGMDIEKHDDSLNIASDDKRDGTTMDIDCDATVDLKIKSFESKSTNNARENKEKGDQDNGEIVNFSSPLPKKKKTDAENVKRFSTELRKSVSFEKECMKEGTKTLSIWDFGGQFVYYATHQLFHSRHAIYLLVFSLDESIDQIVNDGEKPKTVKPKTMKEYIKFWISSVHSFVGNEYGTEPPIILVGTKKDLLESDADIEQKFEEVRKLFEGSKMLFHIHSEDFAVSNLDACSDEIEKLCTTVNFLVNQQCKNNLIPARWIPLERKLKESRHLKIVNFETVLQFNDENEIPIEEEDQVKLFLQYHHARGTFFYFDDGVASKVVLEPQYIVDAFKCLLTSERFCIVRPSLRESWHKLCDKAILDKDLLHDVWSRDPQNDFSKFEDVLIFFLQKHRIIAEALKFDESDNSKKPDSFGYYIVPSLLSKSTDGAIGAFMKGKKYTQVSLVYTFEHEAVLPTLYYRVVAAGCGKWPLIEFENEPLIFESAAVFKLSVDHAGLLKLRRKSLELLGIGLCPPHRVGVDENDLFRRFVEMVISQELRKFRGTSSSSDKQDQRSYTMAVRCYHKDHKFDGSSNVQELETLKQCNKRRTGCPDSQNHSLKATKILNEWYKLALDPSSIPARTMNKTELSTLSMAFEENWQQLGFQLGFDKAEIEQIDMKRKLTTSIKIFEMLNRWVNREVENATLDVLVRAINKCKRVLKIDKDVLRNLIDGLDN